MRMIWVFLYVLKISFWYGIPIFVVLKFVHTIYFKTFVERKKRRFLKNIALENVISKGRETKVLFSSDLYGEVASTLSKSLKIDPFLIALTKLFNGSLEERKSMTFDFMKSFLEYRIPICVVTADIDGNCEGDVRCAALWFYSHHEEGGIGFLASLAYKCISYVGLMNTFLILREITVFEIVKNETMKDQKKNGYYYLSDLGCDPSCWSFGYGSDTIDLVLRVADKEMRSCYVESSNPKNFSFYKRHGFEVAKEEKFFDVTITCFRRDPKKRKNDKHD